MHDSSVDPLDLDKLLERLRAVAHEHEDAPAAAQRMPQRWLGATDAGPRGGPAALPWGLAARAGGLAPYLLADEAGFVALAYRRLLARAPDDAGQAHLLERLRQHTPRTELLAELALSPEAVALRSGQALRWRWLAQASLWAVHQPLLRGPWLVRGVWRRSERWLSAHLQRRPLGLAWQVASTQQAQNAELRERLQQAEDSAASLHEQAMQLLEHQQAQHSSALDAVQAQAAAHLQRQSAVLQARLQAQERRVQQLHDAKPADGGHAPASSDNGSKAAPAHHAADGDLGATNRHGGPAAPQIASGVAAPASPAAVDDFLAALEVSFRGPVDALQAQLAQDYLPTLQDLRAALGVNGPCLDLGCGRGVWMELLHAEGFAAQGVDLNAAAVDEALAKGLQVEQADALAWLRAQPDGSALLVTAFHLMEHVPFALRLALVTECERVLRPGGMLIMETPNPENLWVATHTFHHDPTHSQPLTPDSLAFLVNYCGLQVVAVPRLHPYPPEAGLPGDDPVTLRLNHMTCGGQDFAVIAQKP